MSLSIDRFVIGTHKSHSIQSKGDWNAPKSPLPRTCLVWLYSILFTRFLTVSENLCLLTYFPWGWRCGAHACGSRCRHGGAACLPRSPRCRARAASLRRHWSPTPAGTFIELLVIVFEKSKLIDTSLLHLYLSYLNIRRVKMQILAQSPSSFLYNKYQWIISTYLLNK